MTNHLMHKNALLAAALLAGSLSLTGCHQYLARHEGITSFAGDSLAANEAISVVDTWPDGFDDTSIPTDGERQAKAIEYYKNPSEETDGGNPTELKLITQ